MTRSKMNHSKGATPVAPARGRLYRPVANTTEWRLIHAVHKFFERLRNQRVGQCVQKCLRAGHEALDTVQKPPLLVILLVLASLLVLVVVAAARDRGISAGVAEGVVPQRVVEVLDKCRGSAPNVIYAAHIGLPFLGRLPCQNRRIGVQLWDQLRGLYTRPRDQGYSETVARYCSSRDHDISQRKRILRKLCTDIRPCRSLCR